MFGEWTEPDCHNYYNIRYVGNEANNHSKGFPTVDGAEARHEA